MKTIFYIGDSTVARNTIHTYPQTGISQALQLYVKEDVRIRSLAKNGRSTKSFLEEGRFVPVQEQIGPGDYLFIQFGHNDEKADPARHTEPYGAFQENLRFFIRTARQAGAHPLLITPIARRLYDEQGVFQPGSHGEYPEAMRQVGREERVSVADLTAMTEDWLSRQQDVPTRPLFMWPKDNTHLKPEGAVKMAGFLASCLEALGAPYCDLLEKEIED